jgi:peptidoglycan/xylan/chitin deacetylase (PgdA/CDA1 family)
VALVERIAMYCKHADAHLGTLRRIVIGERPGLVAVLFHNIFRDEADLHSGFANPLEGVTQDMFASFLDAWHHAGYRFVSLQDVLSGLDPEGRYVLLTFDDGYCSILDVLPILEKYSAPAVLFVATEFIEKGIEYWPDTVYREEISRNSIPKSINFIIEELKNKPHDEVSRFIADRYGSAVRVPKNDIARPLSHEELAMVARHPLIEIGNHSVNHVDLTICSEEQLSYEIIECQDAIERITGQRPVAISYPYGRFNEAVIRVAQASGLQMGFTCAEGKNRIPLNGIGLQLSRYDFFGAVSPIAQCARFRSDIHVCWPRIKQLLRIIGNSPVKRVLTRFLNQN